MSTPNTTASITTNAAPYPSAPTPVAITVVEIFPETYEMHVNATTSTAENNQDEVRYVGEYSQEQQDAILNVVRALNRPG